MRETPLTVGSPQQVIERTLTFREHFGDYQRQLFLADHAGLPLKTVLEQLDILGEEVVPVLRRELDALRPAHVPDGPTHASPLEPSVSAADVTADARRRRRPGRASDDPARWWSPPVWASRRPPGCSATGWPRRRSGSCRTDPVDVEVVELREYARDLANSLVTGFPSARLAEVIERVIAADALIAVTPIFSASYSGLFKMFFDVLQPESLAGKPVADRRHGGTARHSLALEHALRPLFTLSPHGRGADRGLRRHRGLGSRERRRATADRADRPGRRRARRPARPAHRRLGDPSGRDRHAVRRAAGPPHPKESYDRLSPAGETADRFVRTGTTAAVLDSSRV